MIEPGCSYAIRAYPPLSFPQSLGGNPEGGRGRGWSTSSYSNGCWQTGTSAGQLRVGRVSSLPFARRNPTLFLHAASCRRVWGPDSTGFSFVSFPHTPPLSFPQSVSGDPGEVDLYPVVSEDTSDTYINGVRSIF